MQPTTNISKETSTTATSGLRVSLFQGAIVAMAVSGIWPSAPGWWIGVSVGLGFAWSLFCARWVDRHCR